MITKGITDHQTYNAQIEREQNRIGKKIQEIRLSRGIQQKELSRLLVNYGVNVTPAAISKWEVGEGLPNPYQLFAVCAALQYDHIAEFFTCGNYSGLSELNEEGQAKVQEYIKILIASKMFENHVERVRKVLPKIEIKVFDLPASAGTGDFVDSDSFEKVSFVEQDVPEGTDFGIRIDGNSMMPNYQDGQIAMVHRQDTLRNGDIGIFLVDNDAYIKQYTESVPGKNEQDDYTAHDGTVYPKITLVSLNPEYKNITVKPSQRLTVIGKVLN